MLRFGVLGLAVTQALFFWVPWKPAHLLPALLAGLLWLGASRRNQRGFLWLVVAAVAIGVVLFAVTLYERLFVPKPWIGPISWNQL